MAVPFDSNTPDSVRAADGVVGHGLPKYVAASNVVNGIIKPGVTIPGGRNVIVGSPKPVKNWGPNTNAQIVANRQSAQGPNTLSQPHVTPTVIGLPVNVFV